MNSEVNFILIPVIIIIGLIAIYLVYLLFRIYLPVERELDGVVLNNYSVTNEFLEISEDVPKKIPEFFNQGGVKIDDTDLMIFWAPESKEWILVEKFRERRKGQGIMKIGKIYYFVNICKEDKKYIAYNDGIPDWKEVNPDREFIGYVVFTAKEE